MTDSKTLTINDGPSKFDLMVSLFTNGKPIYFGVEEPPAHNLDVPSHVAVFINGLQRRVKGHHDYFILEGSVTRVGVPAYPEGKVTITYKIHNRTGQLKFID